MNRKISTSVLAVATLATAFGLGACKWSTFDDLASDAWVDSSGSPGNLNADDYGVAIVYGGAPDPAGVVFVTVGLRPDGVAMIDYDASGKISTNGETISELASTPDPMPVKPPLAADLSASTGAVGLGLSEAGGSAGRVVVFEPVGPEALASIAVGNAGVNALAFGNTNHPDDITETDLVVTTGNLLTLVTHYQAESAERTQDECQIGREVGFAMELADLDSGTAESEIVVAMGNESRDGAASEIRILSGEIVQAAAAASEGCVSSGVRDPLATIAPPGDEPDFGSDLVVADFDGNGTPDLAVGAPSSASVYVYMNIDLASAAPGSPTTIAAPAGPGSFGEALAAGDFDGDGSDELVVGDSSASVDGTSRAGQAYIYDSTFGTPIILNDAQPEADQHFGRALAVGVFGGTDDVLCVGAVDEVFTYFRTPVAGDADVRQ